MIKSIYLLSEEFGTNMYNFIKYDLSQTRFEKERLNNSTTKRFLLNRTRLQMIFYDALTALEYLTVTNCVCHRDIKPENVLIKMSNEDKNESIIKIIDFGWSRQIRNERTLTKNPGTAFFLAPEVIQFTIDATEDQNNKIITPVYGFSMDVYSLGLVFAKLMIRENLLHFVKSKIFDLPITGNELKDNLRPIEVLFKNEEFYINIEGGNQIRKDKKQEVINWINENIEHLKKNNKPGLAAKLKYDKNKSILN